MSFSLWFVSIVLLEKPWCRLAKFLFLFGCFSLFTLLALYKEGRKLSRPMQLRVGRELVSPDKKRPKNTSSETPTRERRLTVRRWMCEPVGLNGLHGQPVALSCDSCVH